MFSCNFSPHQLFSQLLVINEKTQFEAVIDLNSGGSLTGLTVRDTVIINKITDPRPVDIHYSSFLFPFVNRLDGGEFRFRESEYQFPINEVENNNAIHGLLFDQLFKIQNVTCNEARAIVDLHYHYKGDLTYFPFPFEIKVKYTFTLQEISVDITAHNLGTEEFPFSLGWHPYFNLPYTENNHLSFDSKNIVRVNDRCIPVGVEEFNESLRLDVSKDRIDDCYELKSPDCHLTTSEYELSLTSSAASKYLQIYHPPGTNHVAVEPLTGITDCFNNGVGLRTLIPKASFSQTYFLKVETGSN